MLITLLLLLMMRGWWNNISKKPKVSWQNMASNYHQKKPTYFRGRLEYFRGRLERDFILSALFFIKLIGLPSIAELRPNGR
jgi:hypothetical protein